MNEFWDRRYSEKGFAYGKEPNGFFGNELEKLSPGRILLIGEGEGRNAVFAASIGWTVDAVDFSEAAKEKALALAAESGVKINYQIADLNSYTPPADTYDAVGIVFVHLEEELRSRLFSSLADALRPEGRIILEAFEKDQINKSSGGPKNPDVLNSLEDVVTDFQNLDFEQFSRETINLNEGNYHRGEAVVIRFVGKKPSDSD